MSDKQIPESLKIVTNKYPQLNEIVLFGYELLMELRKTQPALDLNSLKFTHELVNIKLKEGSPLLKKSEITIPSNQLKDIFQRISLIVAENRKPLQSRIIEVLKRIENRELDIQKLAISALKSGSDTIEGLTSKEGSGFLVDFLIRISLKPFGRAYGIALNPYLSSEDTIWQQSYCPICGSYPLLAYIEGEEGRRWLICSWCDTPWVFSRIKCPYCQNIDQKDLNYFSLNDENEKKEKNRVCVCEKCKKYIKTLNVIKWEGKKAIDCQLDDLATIHFDLLAEREGYKRMVWSFLSF